ncbi:MAG: Asp23/Gls24 family envelope stress response protein [Ruminococcus sp.]|nr:Asp23/Gls24 family envelope stress response protein [Ruminococcus sp.]
MAKMLYMENHIGKISISDAYLRELTEQTVLQCFGVAGLADVKLTDLIFEGRRSPVTIMTKDQKLVISIHIKVMYGVNIPAVVHSLIHKIEFVIEDAVRIPASLVQVYVDEIVEP